MRGGGTSMHERLGRLWQEYHRAGMGHEFAASQTPLARVIPVEETVTPDVEVLPYEQLSCRLTSAGMRWCFSVGDGVFPIRERGRVPWGAMR
jgi:hypothetical protein